MVMDIFKTRGIFVIPILLLLAGCKPEFEVFAPEKDLYAVYGVLHPDKDYQYVKISRVYQFEGDAYLYASQNDLTVKGLNMTLSGNGDIIEAVQLDSVPRDPGDFVSSQTIYRFDTRGATRLVPGQRYNLRITRPDNPDWLITSTTVIPEKPIMQSPGEPLILPGPEYTLPSMDFSEDTEIQFFAGNAMGFEVRVIINYRDGGEEKQMRWGPTPVFTEDVRCPGSKFKNERCYEIPEMSVVRLIISAKERSQGSFGIEEEPRIAGRIADLPTSCYVEATAIDSGLTTFLAAENPFGFGLNLLMDRPNTSNISGDNTGIFGSINTDRNYFVLGTCTKYLSGMIDPVFPPIGCGD